LTGTSLSYSTARGKTATNVDEGKGPLGQGQRLEVTSLRPLQVSVADICRHKDGIGCRYVQMALKLLYEKQLGKDSRLKHYVESLPGNFSSPLTWSRAELAALQYPSLQQEVSFEPGLVFVILIINSTFCQNKMSL